MRSRGSVLPVVGLALLLSAPLSVQAAPPSAAQEAALVEAPKRTPAKRWPPRTSWRDKARGVLPTISIIHSTLAASLRMTRDAAKWRAEDARRGAVTPAIRRERAAEIDKRLEAFGKKVISAARIDLAVEGTEDLAGLTGGAIIIANHESHLDGPILLSLIDRLGPTRVAGSQHLFDLPVLGQAMQDAGLVAIDRKNTADAKRALARAADELGETNLLIFPEGGRGRGSTLPLKKGAFHQAINMDRPILPIHLEGVGEALPADAAIVRPDKHVRVVIGKPIWAKSVDELKLRSEAFFADQGVHFPPAPPRTAKQAPPFARGNRSGGSSGERAAKSGR